jgi:uridylate kinase
MTRQTAQRRSRGRFVISLGGSLVAPPGGVAVGFIKELRQLLLRRTALGDRFVLVCGGGQPARDYMAAVRELRPSVTDRELDVVGIAATSLNAHLVQAVLGPLAHAAVVSDPRVNLRVKAPIIVAAGWKPGCSTDKDAVLLAERFQATTVINLSNIPYVYDKDPKKYKSAKPIERMSWRDFGRAFGTKWSPGLNAPFDPVAAQLAKRSGIRAVIADGRDLKNLERILDDRAFRGTILE